jgi:hypothetical protein
MSHATLDQGSLDGLAHQLCMSRAGVNRFGKDRHSFKRCLQIDILKRMNADHLLLNLPGQSQRRCPVHFGIPKPRQQIGRAGAGNRKGCRRASRQLTIARGGKRRRTFMTYTIIPQCALAFLNPYSICKAEI